MLSDKQMEKTRKWIYKNARPLDLARWNYHLENGSADDVISALRTFQNPDGGFAHALEADCWNTESSPMQTWCATEIMHELEKENSNADIVKGILSYLEAGPYYIDGKWIGTIPSNDDFPHAPWWSYSEEAVSQWNYNPSACLAGFVLKHSEKGTGIYRRAIAVAAKAADWFLKTKEMESMHETFSFMRLWEYCKLSGMEDIFDMDAFEVHLRNQISSVITQDTTVWRTDYVCRPSLFIHSIDSPFYIDNKRIIEYETEFILNTVNDEGVWDITWNWNSYPEEWKDSEVWWKADRAIKNLLYLRGLNS